MKKRIIAAAAIVAVLVAGYGAAWLYFAGRIHDEIARLGTPAAAGVPTLRCDAIAVAGFPFRFDATCTDAVLVDGDARFALPHLKATALVYRPTHVLAFLEGPMRYTDAFHGTERELRWSQMEASIRLDGWQMVRLSVHAEDLAVVDTLMGETVLASAPVAEFHLVGQPENRDPATGRMGLGIFARTESVDVPPLDIAQGRLTFEAEISAMPADVRSWGSPDMLRAWQAAGGEMTVNRLEADDTRASLRLEGTLGLNDNGEARGDMVLTSTGVAERLEGVVPRQMRTLLFGGEQADGSQRQTVTIRRGAVLAGIAPLVTLPPVF